MSGASGISITGLNESGSPVQNPPAILPATAAPVETGLFAIPLLTPSESTSVYPEVSFNFQCEISPVFNGGASLSVPEITVYVVILVGAAFGPGPTRSDPSVVGTFVDAT